MPQAFRQARWPWEPHAGRRSGGWYCQRHTRNNHGNGAGGRARRRRDSGNHVYGGCFLPADTARFAIQPGDGAPVPPLHHIHQVPGMPDEIKWGTALVLLLLVLSFTLTAAVVRARFRRKRKW